MTSPHRILRCSEPGCSAERYQMSDAPSSHGRAVRMARILGWTGDDSTGCLCANRQIKCPEHGTSPGQGGAR